MIDRLALGFLRSRWGRVILAALGLLAGVGAYGALQHKNGRRAESARRDVENIKAMRRAEDAGARVRTDRRSIADRMRNGTF